MTRGEVAVGQRTDAEATVTLVRTGFLNDHMADPIAILADGAPLCVVSPLYLSTLQHRSSHYELALDLASPACAPARRMPLSCTAGRCTVVLPEPTGAFCDGALLELAPDRAISRSYLEGPPSPGNGPQHRFELTLPVARPGTRLVFAGFCSDGRGAAWWTQLE